MSETGGYFIVTAFQICYGICHQEGSRKPGEAEAEWNITASGFC